MAKILVIDDEPSITNLVTAYLKPEGYEVFVASDGNTGLKSARTFKPDLIILDVMLPGMDGIELLSRLRRESEVYVIMLTARAEETDKVVGLSVGADDYMTKPFSPRELVARVKAVLRRQLSAGVSSERFQLGTLRVDWGAFVVTVKGKSVALTPKEFELLRALIEAKGRVLSREKLLERVWGYDRAIEIETRTVDLHISQLRKKLGPAGRAILTVKQAGYRFAMDD